MNWSKYNFLFFSEKHGYLLYNSLSNLFAQIDGETALSLNEIMEGKADAFKYFTSEEIVQLQKNKILTDDDYDEYLNIKLQKHLKRFDKSQMNLTIAPTLDCNFNCDYCFEESRPKVYMSDKIEDDIIKFIKRHEQIKTLYITWYGGEPLLNFKRIISLTKKIEELKIDYYASIITNGYLLTQEKIDKFLELKIKYIHITIDGPKEIHNSRRPHVSNKNSFDAIYGNMLKLLPHIESKKMKLTVRVNVDKTNESYFHEIYQKIREDFKNIEVTIYPGIVKKTYGSCSSIDDILLDNQEQASFNIEQYKIHGIESRDFLPIKHSGECIARQIFGYLIDPRGDIYKCWTDTGKITEAIGNVNDETLINTAKLTRYLTGADVFDKEECQKCFFLPVCGGGCPHLSIKKMICNHQIDLCHIAKNNLEEFLEIYYEIKTNRKIAV